MFFSSAGHKEEHQAWSGLIDGVFAIAATLVMYNSSIFWSRAFQLVKEKSITQSQATMIIIDHLTCMIISAIICIDLWGLCSIAYRTPGKGNRLTSFHMIMSMITGVGITTAFQVIFDWRLELTEKNQFMPTTYGPEIGLIIAIVMGYVSTELLLKHVKTMIGRQKNIEISYQYKKKLNAAITHCTRSAIIISIGGFLFMQFNENVWGVGILAGSIIINWLYPEVRRKFGKNKI